MKKYILFSLLFVFLININGQEIIPCTIETELGKIEIELYPEKAPRTVKNFLRYVDSKLYDNTSFFRVCTPENEAERDIKIEVIQGGDVDESKAFDPIEIETTEQSGLKHLNGSISMARAEPNSATSSFFICIGNQKELDFGGKRNPDGYGFAVFAKVTKGMELVKNIQQGKNKDQYLLKKIKVNTIKRNE